MYKKILLLAIPIIIWNILQTIYQFTDLFWIWRYNDTWIAAIWLTSTIIFLFVSIQIWFTMAWTILTSQAKWKKDYEKLNKVVGQSIVIWIIIWILIWIIWYLSSDYVISLTDAEEIVKKEAIWYLKITFLWVISVSWYMIIQALFRGLWEVKIPVYILLFTIFLNFLADPFLIMWYGPFPELWVNWAAVSTIFTQTIAWIIALFVLYSKWKYHLHFKRKYLKLHKDLFKKILSLWIPTSLEMSARSLWSVVLTYIVATFSTAVISAYTIWNQILWIIIFIALGFSMAITTLSGQYFWAWKTDKIAEVRKYWTNIVLFPLFLLWIIIFIFAPYFVEIFAPGKTEIIKTWATFLRIMALFLWSIGFQEVIIWMFRWIWETKIPMYLTIASIWILEVPISYFGSKYFWENAIWWSIPIANIIIAWVSYIWYINWTKKIIKN